MVPQSYPLAPKPNFVFYTNVHPLGFTVTVVTMSENHWHRQRCSRNQRLSRSTQPTGRHDRINKCSERALRSIEGGIPWVNGIQETLRTTAANGNPSFRRDDRIRLASLPTRCTWGASEGQGQKTKKGQSVAQVITFYC